MPTLSIKAWIGVALVTIGLIVFGILKYQDSKIDTLNQAVGGPAVVIEAAANTADLKDKAGKVDEQHVTNLVVKDAEVKQATTKRILDTHAKVEQISDTFDALPATPENKVEEERQTSEARITTLWDAYCAAKPAATGCPTATPPAQDQSNENAT